jgi:single-strand DNA-binding protein
MQNLLITGNLGKDPEARYTPAGKLVVSFSVATNEQYEKDGEKVKKTTWFRVQAWGKLAEICQQYLGKGSKVFVQGKLVADDATGGPKIWESKDGAKHASFEIMASSVEFLSTVQKSTDDVDDAFPIDE